MSVKQSAGSSIAEPPLEAFTRSAHVYDRFHAGKNYSQEAAMVSHHLTRCSGLAAGYTPVLEFGAGTGRMTKELLRIGHPVHATEPSPAMRAELERAKIPCYPCGIHDESEWTPFHGAVAHFTVVSYACMDTKQLRSALASVRKRLFAGAAFIFDVINYACAAGHLREYETQYLGRAREGVDHRIMRKQFNVETGVVTYDIGYSVARATWSERHFQRAFTPAEIRDALAETGWGEVLIFDPGQRDAGESDAPSRFSWTLQVVARA